MLRSRDRKSLDLCGFQDTEPGKQRKDTYLDKGNWHERNTIRDHDLEPMVLAALQKQLDLRASSAENCEERRQRQQVRVEMAENKLRDMQVSLEWLQGDQMASFEAYKDGTTDKKTFLQQKER